MTLNIKLQDTRMNTHTHTHPGPPAYPVYSVRLIRKKKNN
uniref:Uncharacterized protein n=1 Tax=Anguilla anguilla TaxID=7936 RepID=A0A0E9WIM5_ANGAN